MVVELENSVPVVLRHLYAWLMVVRQNALKEVERFRIALTHSVDIRTVQTHPRKLDDRAAAAVLATLL